MMYTCSVQTAQNRIVGVTPFGAILVSLILLCLSAGVAQSQVRSGDERFQDIELLFDILRATVDRVNVDDEGVRNQAFPGRTFTDFDRNRDGQFMTVPAALGLFDLQLAILQFNHDIADADGDGLSGFIELECAFAGGGVTLDPTASETEAGVPDGAQDCDADQVSNAEEILAGTDPLDPQDWCVTDACGVCDQDAQNDCVVDCAGVLGGNARVDECGVCDDDPTNNCENEVVAQRLTTWVCNTLYGSPEADEDLRLTEVTGGEGFIVLETAPGPCLFHVLYQDDAGNQTRLSQDASGYIFAAAAELNGEKIACVARMDHDAADDGGGPDPDGHMVMRQTTGVSTQCARFDGNQWGPMHTILPSNPDWAGWLLSVVIGPGPGQYVLKYERDFSFQFLNLVQRGRPISDGTYQISFSVDDAGGLQPGPTEKLSDDMFGAPTPNPEDCPIVDPDPEDPRCAPRCGDSTCDKNERCGEVGPDGGDKNAGGCSADCGPCTLIVDDADDPGYREIVGHWRTINEGNGEYARHSEDGVASFSFEGLQAGWKEVWVLHPVDVDATPRARYTVHEQQNIVATFMDDQRVVMDGWRLLGYTYTRGDFDVRVSGGEPGRIYSDAIKVELVDAPAPTIDDGDGLYREVAGVWQSGEGGLEGDHRRSVGGVAEYTLYVQPGVHEIRTRYPSVTPATARAQYTISAEGVILDRVVLDQNRGADDWVSLGRYFVPALTLTISLSSETDQPLIADAVDIERQDSLRAELDKTVDDGDPFFLSHGDWDTTNDGMGGDGLFTADEMATATWQFPGLAPDKYEVLVAYPVDAANTDSAHYIIRDQTGILSRVEIDQSAVHDGWVSLGVVRTTQPVLTLQLSRLAGGGVLRADAVRLVSTGCEDCQR